MKIKFIILFVIFLAGNAMAQTGKYTEKLQQLYAEEKFEKIIKFKQKKVNDFESRSLYYKGLAYSEVGDLKNAKKFLDLAIEKGPADWMMYYDRGLFSCYMGAFSESITFFLKAIDLNPEEPGLHGVLAAAYTEIDEFEKAKTSYKTANKLKGCDVELFIYLAELHMELEEYPEAIDLFESKLNDLEPNTELHASSSYNLGLCKYLNNDYSGAKETYTQYLKVYPEDHMAISRLIQAHYKLGEIESTKSLRSQLLLGYEFGTLPKSMEKMYCFDQFEWNGVGVLAFDSYGFYEDEIFDWKHKFLIRDEKGDVSYKVQTVLDSTASEKAGSNQFLLYLIKDDTLRVYDHFVYNQQTTYAELKSAVISILENKVGAKSIMPGFDLWFMEERSKLSSGAGTSFETAIVVGSISEEYDWLHTNYPGHQFIMQSLVGHDGKYYDVLTFKTASGDEREAYFDINSFFGKY